MQERPWRVDVDAFVGLYIEDLRPPYRFICSLLAVDDRSIQASARTARVYRKAGQIEDGEDVVVRVGQ